MWKNNLLSLFCIVFSLNSVQSQINEHFTDGDFLNNPPWSGDTANFEIVNGTLHLNAPSQTDTSYLSTENAAILNASWEFWVKMDFNPSSSNYAKVYLISNIANLKGNVKGYFVKIGGLSDEISLYRQDANSETEIINGIDNRIDLNNVRVRVLVTRDATGNWILQSDSTGGTGYFTEGNAFDDTHLSANYFGFFCRYTSTRSDLLYFDSILVSGKPIVDSLPPSITNVSVTSGTGIDVQFSETLEQSSAQDVSHYSINGGIGTPSSAVLNVNDKSLVHLSFTNNFSNGQSYKLIVNGVEDSEGNISLDTAAFTFYQPQYGDIIINEIHADPSPTVGLPEVEFIELFNNTSMEMDLAGWSFSDAANKVIIPSGTLPPDSFLILTDASEVAKFSGFGLVQGVSNFPALNNGGDVLKILDANGDIIDSVNYSRSWYRNNDKDDGGWSLELINVGSMCAGADNWAASIHPNGGTPGRENSVVGCFVDTMAPYILSVQVMGNNQLLLQMNEQVFGMAITHPGNYLVDNGMNNPIQVQRPQKDQVQLIFPNTYEQGILYRLTVQNLLDCSQNLRNIDTAKFIIPEEIESGDIIINEVLFNPVTGGYDFVELVNTSDKIIDLNVLEIAEADPVSEFQIDMAEISPSYLLLPGEYVVLSQNEAQVKREYFTENPKNFIELNGMPNFPNEEGIVRLQLDSSLIIDELHYHEDWHFELVDDLNGLSLERISFTTPTQDESNWHSAASTVGFATPAYQNSQYLEGKIRDGEFSITPEIFSPDGDGYQDLLQVHYQFPEPGYLVNVKIFDANGRLIRNLVQNELLETEGFLTWDGIDDSGTQARIGIHIVYIEVFNLSGDVQQHKLRCVVAKRL